MPCGQAIKYTQLSWWTQYGCDLLMRGEVVNLLSWIEAVETYSQSLPWIAIQKGWALCTTGQLDRAELPLLTAERLIAAREATDEVGTMRGAVIAAAAHRANRRGESRLAAELARQALDCLPDGNDFSCSLRGVAISILGDASWMNGNLEEAQRAYTDAVQISQAEGNIHMVIIASSNLANVLLEQGQLHEAARIYSRHGRLAALPDGQISPLTERVHAGLSRVAYEWNHLEEAAGHVHQCIELAQRWGSTRIPGNGLFDPGGAGTWTGQSRKSPGCHAPCGAIGVRTAAHSVGLHLVKVGISAPWIAQGNPGRAFDLIQKSGITIDSTSGSPARQFRYSLPSGAPVSDPAAPAPGSKRI